MWRATVEGVRYAFVPQDNRLEVNAKYHEQGHEWVHHHELYNGPRRKGRVRATHVGIEEVHVLFKVVDDRCKSFICSGEGERV